MGNLVLKINRDVKEKVEARFFYKDIDAFSDKYSYSKIDLNLDVEAVKAAVRNIFMWNVGEEILFPEFGNNLRRFLYQPLDETSKSELAQEVKRCLEDNEPRVKVDRFALDQDANDAEHSTIRFMIAYHVIGNKTKQGTITDTITISGGAKGNRTTVK